MVLYIRCWDGVWRHHSLVITQNPNMKLFIASILIVAVAADRLDNTYLPPNSARTAGGNGNFLNTPNRGGSSGGSQGGSARRPSENYGAPGSYDGQSGSSGGNFRGQSRDAGAGILRFENENFGDGTYRFNYETENGISHQESGELRNAGGEEPSSAVQGSYSYTADDGNVITVNYVADENGFQPSGDHLPTSPPIPEAIQRSLELIAAQGGGDDDYQGGQGYQSNGQQGGNGGFGRPNKPSFNQQSGYQY